MRTAYVTHPRFTDHDMPGHPEHAGRLRSFWNKLDESGLTNRLLAVTPAPLLEEQILRIHTRALLNQLGQIEAMHEGGIAMLTADTYMSPTSYTLARLAAGAAVAGTEAVMTGAADNALVAVRPPGHHATQGEAMGFCLLNNIALAARHALDNFDIERVMIVDFDVHHGNGTQDIFYDDPSVLFVSTHQFPFYPGTGDLHETGKGAGKGYTLNVPLRPGNGDRNYARIFDEIVWKAARRYQPQLILVSAGFDAHWSDPLAGMNLSLAGYGYLTQALIQMAQELCDGRIVFVMEGGYDLDAVGYGLVNVARALLAESPLPDPMGPARGTETDISGLIEQVLQIHDLA